MKGGNPEEQELLPLVTRVNTAARPVLSEIRHKFNHRGQFFLVELLLDESERPT